VIKGNFRLCLISDQMQEKKIAEYRMIQKSPEWIAPEEGEQIIAEIIGNKKDVIGSSPKKKKYDDARLLFMDRCTMCHSVNRILTANKTRKTFANLLIYNTFFSEGDLLYLESFNGKKGVPQGGIISPLLSNLCLNEVVVIEV
jgi:Rps23 Pro-64 3,4-dihydroxylase Tpa1-like proline 4-hydroxylase